MQAEYVSRRANVVLLLLLTKLSCGSGCLAPTVELVANAQTVQLDWTLNLQGK
jgi:hypothetical protein